MEKKFWYRNWWLYYLLFFLLLGLLIYALLWKPRCEGAYTPPTASQISEPQEPQEPSPVEVVECNATVESGGQGRTVIKHILGNKPGRVVVQYQMYSQPDRLTITYKGKVVATTKDLVSGEGILEWNYTPKEGDPQECEVEMYAPQEGTEWDYQLNCPQ